jgi:hypothetical protein
LADLLDRFRRSEADDDDLAAIKDRIRTVANEARCSLAQQHASWCWRASWSCSPMR